MKYPFLLVIICLLFIGSGNNTFREIKVGKGHPRLIITGDSVSEIRGRSAGEKKALYRTAIKQADEFCQKEIIEFSNANNSYREIGDGLPVLGLAWLMEGNRKYVTSAEKWIRAMLHTDSWEGSQNLGRSSWIVGLGFLYDWMYDVLDKEIKKNLLDRLVDEASIVVNTASETRALSNHLLIETTAIGIVGLLLPENHPNKFSFLKKADQFSRYIIDHAPEDGSWGEGVQYWQYGTGYFLRFLEAAKTAGYKNYFEDYQWLEKTGYFPIYFSLPGQLTKVINFSDCGTDRYLPSFLFYLPARIYRNGYFQDFGEKVQLTDPHKFSWLDFLFYDASLPAEDFNDLPLFRHFSDHGFVSMRSGWESGSAVTGFRCGPAPGHRNQDNPSRVDFRGFGPGHQQPDINSFVLFAQNEWLVIDPGYTRKKETRNHNTLLVNGHGQAGAGGKWLDYMEFESRTPVPEIVYAESRDEYDYVIGDAGNIYVDSAQLEYFRRHLLFLKPDAVVILDELKAKDVSMFQWNLQLNEITKVYQINREFRLVKNDVEFWVSPVLPEEANGLIRERWLDASDVHGSPGVKGGMLKTISLSCREDKLRFLVVVSVLKSKGDKKPEIKYENNVLTLQMNGKKRELELLDGEHSENRPLLRIIKE